MDDKEPTPHVHPLSTSFGKLPVPALALWSEKEEHAFYTDINAHLDRWVKAANGKLETKIIKGAMHAVPEEPAQEQLCEEVVTWLKEKIQA